MSFVARAAVDFFSHPNKKTMSSALASLTATAPASALNSRRSARARYVFVPGLVFGFRERRRNVFTLGCLSVTRDFSFFLSQSATTKKSHVEDEREAGFGRSGARRRRCFSMLCAR